MAKGDPMEKETKYYYDREEIFENGKLVKIINYTDGFIRNRDFPRPKTQKKYKPKVGKWGFPRGVGNDIGM